MVIARPSEKHTNNSCHNYVCHGVAVNNESTLKTQLYIIEGQSPPWAGGRTHGSAGQVGSSPGPGGAGAGGVGESPCPQTSWEQGCRLGLRARAGWCSEPRWSTARGEGTTPKVPLERAGSPRSVTRSLTRSFRWSKWHKRSYRGNVGVRDGQQLSPKLYVRAPQDRPRHPAHLAMSGQGPRLSMSLSPAILTPVRAGRSPLPACLRRRHPPQGGSILGPPTGLLGSQVMSPVPPSPEPSPAQHSRHTSSKAPGCSLLLCP